jgi:hypothetical protein
MFRHREREMSVSERVRMFQKIHEGPTQRATRRPSGTASTAIQRPSLPTSAGTQTESNQQAAVQSIIAPEQPREASVAARIRDLESSADPRYTHDGRAMCLICCFCACMFCVFCAPRAQGTARINSRVVKDKSDARTGTTQAR